MKIQNPKSKIQNGTLVATIFLLMSLHLGGQQAGFAQATLPHSMKGYELYSWQSRGQWYFSLLVGTNRQKSYPEIVSPGVRIKGTAQLKRKLDLLPEGEELTWSKHRIPKMKMPPRSIVDEIIDHCRERRLNLRVLRLPAI
jgi:hypothetical protein